MAGLTCKLEYDDNSTLKATMQGLIRKCVLIGYESRVTSNNSNNNNKSNSSSRKFKKKLCWKETIVVKVANKNLVLSGTNKNGNKVFEDVRHEAELLKYLTKLMRLELKRNDCNNNSNNNKQLIDKYNFSNYKFFTETDEDFLLGMEYCAGDDLYYYVKNNIVQFKKNRANWILEMQVMFRKLVATLDWMHKKANICHLDISLENVMLRRKNDVSSVVLIDFGLAQKYENNNYYDYRRVGKSDYMAPEVTACGQKYENGKNINEFVYDARMADIWSLGVTLYASIFACFFANNLQHNVNWILENNSEFKKRYVEEMITNKNDKNEKKLLKVLSDLFGKIFVKEKDRMTMEQLKKHPFVTGIIVDDEKESDALSCNKKKEKKITQWKITTTMIFLDTHFFYFLLLFLFLCFLFHFY